MEGNNTNYRQPLNNDNFANTDPGIRIDNIIQFCKVLFEVPIATVSLIEAKSKWFARDKLPVKPQGVAKTSFCKQVLAQSFAERFDERIIHTADALNDKKFKDNPHIENPDKIRFFAGFILRSSDGFNLGALAVMDQKPRELSVYQKDCLIEMGLIVEDIVTSLNQKDKTITSGIYNRSAFSLISSHVQSSLTDDSRILNLVCLKSDINSDSDYAEEQSMLFTMTLKRIFGDTEIISRITHDKFVVLVASDNADDINLLLGDFQKNIQAINSQNASRPKINYQANAIALLPSQATDTNLLAIAEAHFN